MTPFQNHIRSAMQPLANASAAIAMRAYQRDQFEFLGVAAPARRAATMPLIKAFKPASAQELIAEAQGLWNLAQREYQYIAVDLLARHVKVLSGTDIPALLNLALQKSWWDSVDGLVKVMGTILKADKTQQSQMDAALLHPDFWIRRIAMLHQLGWKGDTDVIRLQNYTRQLAPESEFFIRKAIGWALREYAWHDPGAIRAFLLDMGDQLSPLSRREAAKHL
ncbi:DNA alkylation repair protein [Iodobacter fluviatilis]|uniref:3-methyladenine DNA glycosylase AlkD n=1 Tax=Iodobacter fluviatilis TaxID=537 RepID=A0A377Q777_9NEIS|nr:DNA alkylation repair protein [Iodobacter fluviatilis]TCU84098.1 3-methyladenine DNA glycosylase AlkD [Iodobacter fluviatilis]STQ89711.1 DNA alkylation repair enzyme [Iodobacter fluviatilis]